MFSWAESYSIVILYLIKLTLGLQKTLSEGDQFHF